MISGVGILGGFVDGISISGSSGFDCLDST